MGLSYARSFKYALSNYPAALVLARKTRRVGNVTRRDLRLLSCILSSSSCIATRPNSCFGCSIDVSGGTT